MSETVPMTPEGHRRLQEELKNLIRIERPKVIQDIAEARAHGDLSENAEYDAAKNNQGFVEGRISEINGKMAYAQVIDPSTMDTRVLSKVVSLKSMARWLMHKSLILRQWILTRLFSVLPSSCLMLNRKVK